MAVRIVFAEPGPEADAALRRFGELAYLFADKRIAQAAAAAAANAQDAKGPEKATKTA